MTESEESAYNPEQQLDPHEQIVRSLMEQHGLLSTIAARNPELAFRVPQFLIGGKGIQVVGGESGMGKSLMVADLRYLHGQLQPFLPTELQSTLCVLTWDRIHQGFFSEISTELGTTTPLPSGETHPTARAVVSNVLADSILFARKYITGNTKLLIEAPLIDIRGETIFDELEKYRSEIQTFIMHSPRSRHDTLEEGRLMPTSGQPDAMNSIRENLLKKIRGQQTIRMSPEAQDVVIREWWESQLAKYQGMVVAWDPEDDREAFDTSVGLYKDMGITPDIITPKQVSRYSQRQFESVLGTFSDIDAFLKTVVG